MLALEHSRRQQPFAFSYGMESAFNDPYLNQNMSTYAPFDSTASFNSIPYPFHDSNSLASEALPDTANLAMFAFQFKRPLNPSSPRSELPPPTLSNASAASIPSNTSSAVGSPYSTHAQAASGHDSWRVKNQGFEGGPTIVNNDDYDPVFGGVDLDSELNFRAQGKVGEDFVGEYTKASPSQRHSSKSVFPRKPQSCQPSPFPSNVRNSARGECLTIDSVLERANTAINSGQAQTLSNGPRSIISSGAPEKRLHASSQNCKITLQNPPTSDSTLSRTPKLSSPSFSSATSALAVTSSFGEPPINMSAFKTAAETSASTHAGCFQSHFFAQNSGNFMPPTELSCWFFLARSSSRILCRFLQSLSFYIIPNRTLRLISVH